MEVYEFVHLWSEQKKRRKYRIIILKVRSPKKGIPAVQKDNNMYIAIFQFSIYKRCTEYYEKHQSKIGVFLCVMCLFDHT